MDNNLKNLFNKMEIYNNNFIIEEKENKKNPINNINDEEECFWKVFHNKFLFNRIIQHIGIDNINENVNEQNGEELIEDNNHSNNFKDISSLEIIIEKKQWNNLKDKIKNNQFIRMEKSSLNILYSVCKDKDIFRSLYNNSCLSMEIVDPIFYSAKNNNHISLQLFIEEFNLPIYPSTLEFAILNSSLKTIQFLINSLIKRNIEIDYSFKKRALINSFKNYKSSIKSDYVTEYLLENKELLLAPSIDIVKIPIQKCLNLKKFQTKQLIFQNSYMDFSNATPVLKEWLIKNYNGLSILDLCFSINIILNCEKQFVDLKNPPQFSKVIESIRERVEQGPITDDEYSKINLLLKGRLIQLIRVDELFLNFLNEFGFEKGVHSLSYCPMAMVYQYTFQSFNINGLTHLSHTQTDIPHSANPHLKPNYSSVIDSKKIVNFIKYYFSPLNKVNYNGWEEISKFCLLNCSVDVLNEIISIPSYPIKSFLLTDIQFKQFSKYQWFIEKIVVPYGLKLHKMSMYNSYFKSNQVSKDYYYREMDEKVLISIENCNEIDFIDYYRNYFQLGNDLISINFKIKKLIGGNGFFTIINSIDSARYCCKKFPNIPKDLIYYNLIVKTILSCNINQMKIIDQYDGCSLNYFKGYFNFSNCSGSIMITENIINLFNYLNSTGFKSFSRICGVYYLLYSLIKSYTLYENGSFNIVYGIFSNLTINQFPKCFIELFITLCFSNYEKDLELAKLIIEKLDFDIVLSVYQFVDLKFKFHKNLLEQSYSVDKRRDEDQYDIILSIIQTLFKNISNENQKYFHPLYQHLYNIALSCKVTTLDKIKLLHNLYNSKSIPLKVGFYHSFFYLDIKNSKLGRYYLFIRVDGLENDTFEHGTGYNGDIIPYYSLETELCFDYICNNSYNDIFYLLRTVIMVQPLPGYNCSDHLNGIEGNSTQSKSNQQLGKVNPFEYSFDDKTFCDQKQEEVLYSLNQDIEYLSTFNQYNLIIKLLKDSMEASKIDSETLKDRTKSFLICCIDCKSLKKIINLGIKGLDFQLLEQSFYESRLDLIDCILKNYGDSIIKSGKKIKNDKHFLFQSNHLDIIGFMFENYIQLMPEFDPTWFEISFENGLIEMCLIIIMFYPQQQIIISNDLLEKTIQNKNINIVKYFYKNYQSFNYLKLNIQSLIKKYYPLDYKYFDWILN
ncbi:hypothetical protein RB653_010215 [Dictyostelium firmibasis]|uniref:Uncharacterized protein n=1 Tax=Dictyostelium firmibasis TaxID=79012 RepID=A0AAN7TSS9_9MYCE